MTKKLFTKALQILLGKFAKGYATEISKAQKWIDSAQAQFASAVEEAEVAEREFDKIAKAKIEQADSIMEQAREATQKMEQAAKFKNKIKMFIEE